ncbi:uncharacterized protein [Parasteatoda tepidariorum]|uniref:uncharacterized protein n=1 Tax=Parasteatoda tepidariorum TaxID=114398 RepID=UPI001C729A69|nr:uncharacterized protein LOC107454274 [Parasteatoda tepidariorum]XP_015926889.2 uncharacterized protein LOC107454274 [Parasteatoda tepidariorum]XP_015926891.2 uncharacterized protein LOC107454274 [Parasteatoda tepidariorum]XP_042899709.1 uncharacterized protein LOC107454274 [Parasteatoda tepidariorum]XP_042899710.1 uncharacterized protein LOC107454274 [Parasteatoda tepidariorum]
MDKICCIVNFEGFNFDNKFLVREFGWINIDTGKIGVNRFNLRPFSTGLTPKESSTIRFTENKLHGLSFCPARGENTISLDLLDAKVTEVYEKCKSQDKCVVAYKGGGKTKRDILERLKIPFKNIEDFGCPKYTELVKYHVRDSCGFHQRNLPCSISQVCAYKAWLLDNMHELMKRKEFCPENCSSDEDWGDADEDDDSDVI